MVNPGHEFGYRPFPEPQMAALESLARDLISHYEVPAHRVLGHADVAPARKSDPGELFDWRRLAQLGIGVWSDEDAGRVQVDPVQLLGRYGYEIDGSNPTPAVIAFQRHFRPSRVDGFADAETVARLGDLCARFT